jgi:predicted phage terminase large subunit-like protein
VTNPLDRLFANLRDIQKQAQQPQIAAPSPAAPPAEPTSTEGGEPSHTATFTPPELEGAVAVLPTTTIKRSIDEAEEHEAAVRAERIHAGAAVTAMPEGVQPNVIIRIPAPRPHQAEVLDRPHRFKAGRAGRRRGKTRLEFIAAVRGHGPRDGTTGQRKFKGMAQGGDIGWIAPDYGQSDVIWEEEILPRFYGRAGVTVSEKHRLVGLGKQLGEDAGGEPVYQGSIRIRSAENINSVRGKELDGIIVDEGAFLKLLPAWRRVLRPTLINRKGWAIIASTTDIGSDFNQLMAEVEAGKRGPNWTHWHWRTRDDPYIDDEEKEELAREYPPGSAEELQELDAELLETMGTLFRDEYFQHYQAISTDAVWIDGLRYPFEYLVMTVDLAASLKQKADYTCILVAGVCFPVDGIRRVAIIEIINEKLEGPAQIDAMEETALRYRPAFIDIEKTGYQLTAVQHLAARLRKRRLVVDGVTLPGDKRTKAVPAASAMSRREWYYPTTAPWLSDTKAQLLKFPNGKEQSKLVADHDDIVDTHSLLAARVGTRANSSWRVRRVRTR